MKLWCCAVAIMMMTVSGCGYLVPGGTGTTVTVTQGPAIPPFPPMSGPEDDKALYVGIRARGVTGEDMELLLAMSDACNVLDRDDITTRRQAVERLSQPLDKSQKDSKRKSQLSPHDAEVILMAASARFCQRWVDAKMAH